MLTLEEFHESILNPKLPGVVYKFRSLKSPYTIPIVANGETYLASPATFNDPHDCAITIDFESMRDHEVEQFADSLLLRQRSELERLGIDLNEKRRELMTKWGDRNKRRAYQYQWQVEYEKSMAQFTGVFCTTADWRPTTLWGYYADDHKGVAIGFKTDALVSSRRFDAVKGVEYLDTYPIIAPLEHQKWGNDFLLYSFFNKGMDWHMEQEVRFVKQWFSYGLRDETLPEEERKVSHGVNSVAEVVVGMCCHEKNLGEQEAGRLKLLVQLCEENNIPVYKTHKVRGSFNIDRKHVQNLDWFLSQ